MTEAATGPGSTKESAAPAGLAELAGLAPDGPDEMGRELAEGPAAVEGALAAVEHAAPLLAALFHQTRRTVLVGTGASLAVARTAAPAWRKRDREQGKHRPLVIRESTSAVLGDADGDVFLPTDLVLADLAVRLEPGDGGGGPSGGRDRLPRGRRQRDGSLPAERGCPALRRHAGRRGGGRGHEVRALGPGRPAGAPRRHRNRRRLTGHPG